MCTNRMLLVGALGVMLGAISPRAAAGQVAPSWASPRPVDGGPSVVPAAVARHTALGVFGAYTPETRGVSTGQVGLAVDVTPFARPLGGRVEPFLSLGAGALHSAVQAGGLVIRPGARPLMAREFAGPAPVAAVTTASTAFLLAPSAGARVQVRPGVAVQGDVRRLVAFGGGAAPV